MTRVNTYKSAWAAQCIWPLYLKNAIFYGFNFNIQKNIMRACKNVNGAVYTIPLAIKNVFYCQNNYISSLFKYNIAKI